MRAREKRASQAKSDSYIEVRLLAAMMLAIMGLALVIPAILRAADANGDNLDDTWEAQYGITTNAYAATNLVGWWQFNGTNSTDNATDRSGNGITGTLTNFPSVAYGAGLFSNALYFTPTASVNFPTTNSVLNAATNQFTFSAWFQVTNSTTGNPATIVTWADTQTNAWSVQVGADGAAAFSFFPSGSPAQTISPSTNAISLYDGGWHQVAATFATNQVATLYVDGQTQASGTITNWAPGSVDAFIMGVPDGSSTNQPFALDETRLYNRALGASEVVQLPVTYTDLNASGLTVFEDYEEGLDPLTLNTIVTSGFLSSGLTAYYGASAPIVSKASGDKQTVAASTFAANPLVITVMNSSGVPLVGAPVTFTIPSGSSGGIAQTSGGTTTTSLSLTTNGSGNATVYYQAGPENLQNNTIQATAVYAGGSVSVNFTARCGAQSGLMVWLRADEGVTQSGGTVSAWADQMGNYNVTQATTAKQPGYVASDINGEPALHFTGTQWLYNSANMGLNNDMTIVTVAMTTAPTASELTLFLGNTSSSLTCRGAGYGSGEELFNIQGNTGHGAEAPGANTFVVETTTLASNLTSATFYQNGQQTGTATMSTAENLTAGVTVGDHTNGSSGDFWNGDIAEVLVYNHQLSSTELQEVGVYLADKYGLYNPNATWPLAYSSAVQTEITRNQWSKAQADNYVALQANNPDMLTTGLTLWLKADAGVTQSGGTVSAWADQTGNYNVTQATTADQPGYVASDINGEPALHFTGTQWLYNSANMGLNNDVTIIAVGMTTVPTASENSIFLGNSSNNLTCRGIGYGSGEELFNIQGNTGHGAGAPGAGTFVVETTTLASNLTSATFYQNGQQTVTATMSTAENLTDGVTVGDHTNGSSGDFWNGDIAEVLVYDHQLSSTELQEVGVYLANKYGLYNPNATWPLAYSSAVQAEITLNQWSKAQADNYVAFQASNPGMLTNGLALWLKADAGVTQSGGTVSAWTDQTGNYNVTQATTADQPAYVASDINGEPALRFSGTQWLYNSANMGLNNDVTIIAVGMTTVPSASEHSIFLGNSSNNLTCRGIGYGSGEELFNIQGNTGHGAEAPGAGTFMVETTTLASNLTSATFYQNGQQTGTATMSTAENLTAGVTVGDHTNGSSGDFWNGDIAEVLVYDHQLSSTEMQQVGVYLANKYNLPVTISAPTITPNGGSFASSVSVSFSPVPSPAVIRYTLDGTPPTASSPEYTGAFTLTQSCPVNAAFFLNNVEISPVASAQFYVGDSGDIGISNAWQMEYFGTTGINPNAMTPGGSGLTNLQAYLLGYNPTMYSTNGDGLSDAVNYQLGYSATDTDIDGSGLTNAQQLALGWDPFDGAINPTLPTPPTPDPSDHTAPVINLTSPSGATLLP